MTEPAPIVVEEATPFSANGESLPAGVLNERCAACGYSLLGLPAEGRCPECAEEYDQSMIVLHGGDSRADADLAEGRVDRTLVRDGIGLAVMVVLFWWIWTAGERSMYWWLIGWVVVMFGSACRTLAKVGRMRGGAPMRLCLAPDGFAVVAAESRSGFMIAAEVLESAWFPVTFAVMVGVSGHRAGWTPVASWSIGVILLVAGLAIVNRRALTGWWVASAGRAGRAGGAGERSERAPGRVRPGLTGWAGVSGVDVKELAVGRYRFRFTEKRPIFESDKVSEFIAACSAAQARVAWDSAKRWTAERGPTPTRVE